MWGAGCIVWEILLESSGTPLISVVTRDLREQTRALCEWQELREQAREWLAAQEDPGQFPVLDQVLQEEPLQQKSILKVLQEPSKMISPDAIDLVCKMLTWDPKKRVTAVNALAGKYVSGIHQPAAGRDLGDPKNLSNSALQEWVKMYITK
jgi:serine/threonine protein kinase